MLAAEITSLVGGNLGRPVTPIPGAVQLVTALSATIPLAVASNSPALVVRSHLTRIGIAHLFRAIVGIDDVGAPKPAPDPYQLACARLGIAAQHCTAIEDSQEGITSAAAAGLYVIGIQAPGDCLDADAVYPDLTDPRLLHALRIRDTAVRVTRQSPA
ncbi:MAG TPA: HAD family phosphatase [Streptosporangiaceae bacterium]|nr:HAD family phosphatase [Streptosporangiaceae bacterium]